MNLLLLLVISMWHVGGRNVQATDLSLFFENCGNMNDIDRELSERQIRFSLDLYKATANIKQGFLGLSTMDAFLSLSQLLYGSKGLSQQQLSNVLHYSPDCIMAQMGLLRLIYDIHHLRDESISMNNKIFHAYETDLEDSFVKTISKFLELTPQQVESWKTLTNGNAIYEWAKSVGINYPYNHTFEGEKSLVLASSAVFMSDFIVPSSHGYEPKSTFRFNDKKSVEIDVIKVVTELIYGEFNYRRGSEEVTAQYVKFSWRKEYQNKIKTIIILPDESGDIVELENNIDETIIRQISSNNVSDLIIAILPRDIIIQSAYDLGEPLKNMQLTEIFKETSDFVDIMKAHPIKVGPIFHQVGIIHEWISVNSASVKEKFGIITSHPRLNKNKSFNVNRAFMILTIFETDNPVILSMGRYGWVPGVMDAEIWNNM